MDIKQIAKTLYEAYVKHQSIDLLLDKSKPMNVSDAYKIQKELTNLKIHDNNEKIIGYKISMTSEKMQQLVGKSNEPAYGTFTSTNLLQGDLQLKSDSTLLLEPELIFMLHEDLSAKATMEEIIQKSNITAGLEIPSSRYRNWFPFNESIGLTDIIVDNAFSGHIILGETTKIPPNIDWKTIHTKVYANQQLIAAGVSNEVLGNPLQAVIWLNQKLQEQNQTLKKGMFISSGTFTDPILLKPGKYNAEFDIVGNVSCTVKSL